MGARSRALPMTRSYNDTPQHDDTAARAIEKPHTVYNIVNFAIKSFARV